jgi:hypothetical protein
LFFKVILTNLGFSLVKTNKNKAIWINAIMAGITKNSLQCKYPVNPSQKSSVSPTSKASRAIDIGIGSPIRRLMHKPIAIII